MAQVRVTHADINDIMEVKNISVAGALIVTNDPEQNAKFRIDAEIEMEIFSTHNLNNVSVSGRVVRGEKQGNEYRFGIAFMNLDNKKLREITELVEMAYRFSGQPPLLPF
jgi:c-di-GMP-binding flagellar brake protein YcgR